jgi:hypothetical protein
MKAVIGRQDIPGLIIIAIIGLALTYLGYTKIKKAEEAKKWPVTNGTVTSSAVAGAIKYYPSVTYTYSVDDVVYNSNIISNITFNTKNRSTVEEFLKRYSSGSAVKVYYNGAEPSEAFLEPGINAGNIFLLSFGIILLVIPVFLVLFFKVDLKKDAKTKQ